MNSEARMMVSYLFLVLLTMGSYSLVSGATASCEDPFLSPTVGTDQVARDCGELQDTSPRVLVSGLYLIQPLTYTAPFTVYCDFKTDGGGWTVIQRRVDGSVNFTRGWLDYKRGFGDLRSEFWLGNDKISTITAQRNYQLRIELAGKTGALRYAKYSTFRLGREDIHYQLFLGTYSGNAGHDSLDYHRGMLFSTYDADHDQDGGNCAAVHMGGWWFKSCDHSDLNGNWTQSEDRGAIEWTNHPGGHFGLRFTEMKIRAA